MASGWLKAEVQKRLKAEQSTGCRQTFFRCTAMVNVYKRGEKSVGFGTGCIVGSYLTMLDHSYGERQFDHNMMPSADIY